MKYLLVLMIAIGVMSCESGERPASGRNSTPSESRLGVNTTAVQDESLVVRESDNDVTPLRLTIVSIEDSRCPSDLNINCFHAGWASVEFDAEGNTFSLKVGESKEFSVDRSSFRLTLIDVLPYPNSANQGEKKRAIFIVEMI